MASLLEKYAPRMAVAEKVYGRNHQGEKLSENRKLMIASCLENTNRFMTEAFDNSTGTQRSDMGMFKKFALNLVNVALPNLIAPDLVLVHPMSSMSGYVNYVQYVAGSNKGATKIGDVFNDPFRLGKVDPNYTSSTVVEESVAADAQVEFIIDWTPVVPGTVKIVAGATTFVDNGNGGLVEVAAGSKITRQTVVDEAVGDEGRLRGVPGHAIVTVKDATGAVVAATAGASIDYETGKITLAAAPSANTNVTITYSYNNVTIPQNDLPILNARIEAMPLIAKARRIAIYYSQIAAFQAKTDYGFDLGDQLAEKAVGQLAYEIDTEVVQLLTSNAVQDPDLKWNKVLPYGVSKAEHYEGFTELVAIGRQKIYDKTQRYAPNYMLVASDILPILGFAKGWTAAPASNINGPYFAGTLDGLKVFVSPSMIPGTFALGVNGDDFMTSAAVYAPYMPIVPTQLLGFADGAMSQGFSTLYDLKLLNKDLLVAGTVVAEDYAVLTAAASTVGARTMAGVQIAKA